MAKPIQCLIVENEPAHAEHLKRLIDNTTVLPLSVARICYDGLQAHQFLQHHVVDLLFLDMEMPNINGASLLHLLKEHRPLPIVVIVSVADHRATAFDYSDFTKAHLLKPVNQQDFDLALRQRIVPHFPADSISLRFLHPHHPRQAFQREIFFDNIILIECNRNDKFFYCLNAQRQVETLLHRQLNMQTLAARLPAARFFQPHQSWIVNRQHILSYSPGEQPLQLSGGLHVPISSRQQADFIKWFG